MRSPACGRDVRPHVGRLQSRWTRLGHLSLHVKTGTDPAPAGRLPLVLVHGLLVSSRYMLAAAVRLAPQYPVYALDLPGYGQSSKPPATWPAFDLSGWVDAPARAPGVASVRSRRTAPTGRRNDRGGIPCRPSS